MHDGSKQTPQDSRQRCGLPEVEHGAAFEGKGVVPQAALEAGAQALRGMSLDAPVGALVEAVLLYALPHLHDEAVRLLANATDPENAADWEEAREVGWAFAKRCGADDDD